MRRTKMTYIFCYDDHRNFTEDIKKRFSDTSRYIVRSYHTLQEFISNFKRESDNNSCKVAVIGVPENVDQTEMIIEMTAELKNIDSRTGVILLIYGDKLEEVKEKVSLYIDAYIPRNSNAILRIHNTVKKLFSEHSIKYYRKRRNISLYALILFLIISVLVIVSSWLKFPGYF
jgi:uncharacterized protein (DUF1697 family)